MYSVTIKFVGNQLLLLSSSVIKFIPVKFQDLQVFDTNTQVTKIELEGKLEQQWCSLNKLLLTK